MTKLGLANRRRSHRILDVAEIDDDSSEGVFALRWLLRLAGFILVFVVASTLSSHPSVSFGSQSGQTAECSTVFSALRGMGPPHTTAGAVVPSAENQCARVAKGDLRTSGILLGTAVVLFGISLIPWPDKKQPAPGWFRFEGKWYPPHFEGKLAERDPMSADSGGPSPPRA
jgi:hypothetical protein